MILRTKGDLTLCLLISRADLEVEHSGLCKTIDRSMACYIAGSLMFIGAKAYAGIRR